MRIRFVETGREARLVSGALLVLALGGVVALHLRSPHDYHFIPGCPFLEATGLYCPGCGTLRSTHHLANGRLAHALRFNPLLVAFVPFFGVWLGLHAYTLARGRKTDVVYPGWMGWSVFALIVGYWIVRNIPLGFLEPLRPPS